MATSYTYPGVYLVETANVPHHVTPATTNLTAFVGAFPKGPVDAAVLVTSWDDFESQFGGLDADSTLAAYGVYQFFLNQGVGAWIVRVTPPESPPAAQPATAQLGPLTFTATAAGSAANGTTIAIVTAAAGFNLVITPPDGQAATIPVGAAATAKDFVVAAKPPASLTITATEDSAPMTPQSGALAGGSDIYAPATLTVDGVTFTAIAPGTWGNELTVSLPQTKDSTTLVDVIVALHGSTVETFHALDASDVTKLPAAIATSRYVTAAAPTAGKITPSATPTALASGTDGPGAAESRTTVNGLTITANSPGPWGASLSVQLVQSGGPVPVAGQVDLIVQETSSNPSGQPVTRTAERLSNLDASTAQGLADAITKNSEHLTASAATTAASPVLASAVPAKVQPPAAPAQPVAFPLLGGCNGTWAPGQFTDAVLGEMGFSMAEAPPPPPRLERIAPQMFNLLCIPDMSLLPLGEQETLFAVGHQFCEDNQAFMLIDSPPPGNGVVSLPTEFGGGMPSQTAGQIASEADRSNLLNGWAQSFLGTTNYAAAAYYPWVQIPDPADKFLPKFVPPSGTIAGVYAATDQARGVWKAPAGTAAALANVVALADDTINDTAIGDLNILGINCLRRLPNIGPVVWGSRTLAGADLTDSPWKYVPVRRLTDFIEQSLQQSLAWAVFEPNEAKLWASILLEVTPFMTGLFANGAFAGATAAQAFSVACDATTTSPDDMLAGIVNLKVGFQPVDPAEFVVLTVQLNAGAPAAS